MGCVPSMNDEKATVRSNFWLDIQNTSLEYCILGANGFPDNPPNHGLLLVPVVLFHNYSNCMLRDRMFDIRRSGQYLYHGRVLGGGHSNSD